VATVADVIATERALARARTGVTSSSAIATPTSQCCCRHFGAAVGDDRFAASPSLACNSARL